MLRRPDGSKSSGIDDGARRTAVTTGPGGSRARQRAQLIRRSAPSLGVVFGLPAHCPAAPSRRQLLQRSPGQPTHDELSPLIHQPRHQRQFASDNQCLDSFAKNDDDRNLIIWPCAPEKFNNHEWFFTRH